MEIRKRTIYPHGLNKGIDSKFQGYQIQQTPEEGWKVQQSKCEYKNQYEDTRPNRKA